MYKIAISTGDSEIEGKGVFAAQNISKGTIVWIFTEEHDLLFTQPEFEQLSAEDKELLHKIAYLSPWTGLWVSPPKDDPARYTNHSTENNLTVVYDANISPEPYFIANRDIAEGEEITNNYHEFDAITRQTKPDWAQ